MIRRLLRALDAFWFQPAPASRLALLRILIGGFALLYLGDRVGMLVEIGRTGAELFEPVGVARILPGPCPPEVFQAIVIATLASNVAFVLGWRYSVSGPLFGVLLLWTLCYRNSWSMIYHSDNLLVLHTLVLALAPAADALSLDAARRRRPSTRNAHASYGWPIRTISAVTVLTYFLAGVAKVSGPLGWSWAGGEALRSQIVADALRKGVLGADPPALAPYLFDFLPFFTVLGVATLVLELGAPLALAGRRPARAWVLATFPMHWGIFFVMGIRFRYPMSGAAFLSFLPLERPLAWLGSKLRRAPAGVSPAR